MKVKLIEGQISYNGNNSIENIPILKEISLSSIPFKNSMVLLEERINGRGKFYVTNVYFIENGGIILEGHLDN